MPVPHNQLKYQTPGGEAGESRRASGFPLFALIGLLVLAFAAAFGQGGAAGRDGGDDVAAAGAASAPVAAPATASRLDASMLAALDYVAQRYRVAPDALKPVFSAASESAKGLDPLLIIAVIGIESGFNPFAHSVMGAQGLMQVIPRYHREKLPPESGEAALLDPVANVRVGALVLHESIRRQGGLIEGLQYYAGAADDPERGYSAKVLAEKQRLEQAIRARKITLAMAPESQKPAREAAPKAN